MANGESCCHTPEPAVATPALQTGQGIAAYWPLVVVLSLCLLGAVALSISAVPFMRGFMGLFFVVFALFKLIDLRGFADGFQTYDLLARRARPYALAYPFLELSLGLLYLSGLFAAATHVATVVLMAVSAAGVFVSMRRGQRITCACLGTVLQVPLSTVSLLENIGMGLMAAWMLLL